MSRPGNPYDNAKAESFMKTLKAEEADGQAYRDLAHARSRLADFIDNIYNADRLHSALGYKSPTAFETDFRNKDKRIPETLTPLAINQTVSPKGCSPIGSFQTLIANPNKN